MIDVKSPHSTELISACRALYKYLLKRWTNSEPVLAKADGFFTFRLIHSTVRAFDKQIVRPNDQSTTEDSEMKQKVVELHDAHVDAFKRHFRIHDSHVECRDRFKVRLHDGHVQL